jgi:hypothetical protein
MGSLTAKAIRLKNLKVRAREGPTSLDLILIIWKENKDHVSINHKKIDKRGIDADRV